MNENFVIYLFAKALNITLFPFLGNFNIMWLFFFMATTLTSSIKNIHFSLYLSITSLHLLAYLCLCCITFPPRGNDFYTWFSFLVFVIIFRICCLLHWNCRVPYRVFVVLHTLITSRVCDPCGCVCEYYSVCVCVGTCTTRLFSSAVLFRHSMRVSRVPEMWVGCVLAGTLGYITLKCMVFCKFIMFFNLCGDVFKWIMGFCISEVVFIIRRDDKCVSKVSCFTRLTLFFYCAEIYVRILLMTNNCGIPTLLYQYFFVSGNLHLYKVW